MTKLTLLLLLVSFLHADAQKSNDPQLDLRLEQYLFHTKNLDFTKAMEYMHPKLFTIVPKDQLIQSMDQAFHNTEMQISFDSMAIVGVSPVYKFGNASYRKIEYAMTISIRLADTLSLKNKEMAAAMAQSFRTGFPGKKITIDEASNDIHVSGRELMFAIRDTGSAEWMFLGYERSNPKLLELLYPKQVRQYFKL